MNTLSIILFLALASFGATFCRGICRDKDSMDGLEVIETYIGETKIHLKSYYNPRGEYKDLSFLNLHQNENTSVVAARSLTLLRGGRVTWLDHGGKRFVTFKLKNIQYTFDPNRMFTPKGAEMTLRQNGPFSTEALKEVLKFSDFVKEAYKLTSQNPVIAIHNNSPRYSAIDYLPGNAYEKEALDVYICNASEPRNFFMVTEREHHLLLKENGYNSVLQTGPANLTDDGSLSVYCAFNGIKYINIEGAAYHNGDGERIVDQLGMMDGLGRILLNMVY